VLLRAWRYELDPAPKTAVQSPPPHVRTGPVLPKREEKPTSPRSVGPVLPKREEKGVLRVVNVSLIFDSSGWTRAGRASAPNVAAPENGKDAFAP